MKNKSKRPSNLVKLIRTTLIGGFLVVMPAYLAILVINKMVKGLMGLIVGLLKPITALLGLDQSTMAIPIALLIFLFICLIAGIILKTSYSRIISKNVEPILKKIPGYVLIRSLTNRMLQLETSDKFEVAFVALGETYQALTPAFLVEKHDNNMYTVFVPSIPTPTVGNLYIVPNERVFPVDVPFMDMVKFISRWGESSQELKAAIKEIKTIKKIN